MRSWPLRGFWVLVTAMFMVALVAPAPANVAAATTCTVTTTVDGGAGSLRACLADVNVQTIDMTGVTGTITLNSNLTMLQHQQVTITGPGAGTLAIDGNGSRSIFVVYDGTNALTVTGVTLRHGLASIEAMFAGTITLTRCVLSHAPVFLDQGGQVSVMQSSISGDIYNDAGIWVGGGSVTVTNSTISSNHVGIFIDNGTGRAFGYPFVPGGFVTVANSTIAGNLLDGINAPAGVVQVKNSTIKGNSSGGGIFVTGSGSATATNTIVAGNGQDIFPSGSVSGNANLIGDGSVINGTGNLHGNPLLDTDLRDNSTGVTGFLGTQTYALLPGSPAIGAGDPATCAAALPNGGGGTDQRGVSHTTYGCDIGAFQSRGFAINLPATGSGDGQTGPAGQPFPNPLAATVTSAAGDPVAGGLVNFVASPVGGAAATFSGNPATIGTAGSGAATDNAQVTATANSGRGVYTVNANIAGAASGGVSYTLTNIGPAHSMYLVDNNGDGPPDANQCPVGGVGSTGACTLRDALAAANSGTDTITFKAGLAGPINLTSTLTVMASVALNGPTTSALAIDGGGPITLFTITSPSVTLTISALTLQNSDTAIDNTGTANNGGTVNLAQVTITGNGTAIRTAGVAMNVQRSLVSNNSNAGITENTGATDALTVTNTTITGSGGVGAIYASAVTIVNSTIVGNPGGGLFVFGSTSLMNTVVAGNAYDLLLGGNGDYNLIGDGSSITGSNNMTNTQPLLDTTLRANGATNGTKTLALLPGSPAIGAGGGAGGCGVPDARGVARPATGCDIGAFQSRAFALAQTSGDGQSTPTSLPFPNPLIATVTGTAGDPVAGGFLTFAPPASTATATLSGTPPGKATIGTAGSGATSGAAQVTATANGNAGAYAVNANLPGATSGGINFNLRNTGPPSGITANPGTTPQNAAGGATFSVPLAATVKDSGGAPLGGVSVTFTVTPVAGAGATFAGNLASAIVTTDPSGVATAPALTAGATAGSYTAIANLTPPATALVPGATFTLTNQAGVAKSFVVTTASTNIVAGAATDVTVKAIDASGNTATGYTGTVQFTSNDPLVSPGSGLPADYTFTTTGPTPDNGIHLFTGGVTLKTVGAAQSVTATDRADQTIHGQQAAITVTAGAATHLAPVAGTSPQSAPVAHAFTNPLKVAVTDASGNPVGAGVIVTYVVPASGASGSFAGGVTTATTDGTGIATPPVFTANTTLGAYSVTATASGIAGNATFTLTNMPGPATQLSVAAVGATSAGAGSAPQPARVGTQVVSGVSASFTVTAQDQYGHVATGYTGTVHFTSSDPNAVLPPDTTFTAADQGIKTVTVIFKTPGAQTLSATDTATPGIAGTLPSITISPATLTTVTVTASSVTIKVGESAQLTATATFSNSTTQDATGTVTWSSADGTSVAVDSTGKVTAKAVGNGPVTITAAMTGANGPVIGQAMVTVSAPVFTGVQPAPAPAGRTAPASLPPGGSGPNPAPAPPTR